ncbi:hypothetical protein AAHC03_09446 [Spirometra sp. Aus1]
MSGYPPPIGFCPEGQPGMPGSAYNPQGYPPYAGQGYGAPPAAPGYGAPPAAPGYGAPPAAPGYGAPPAAPGYGAPPTVPGFGAPPGPGYCAPPAPAYGGAAAGPGYGVPPGPAYGGGYAAPGYAGPPGPGVPPGSYGQPPVCSGYPGGMAPPPTVGAQIAGCPTVRPVAGFNAGSDAEDLRQAMRGLGTDEQRIINVLSKRSAAQRKQIAEKYKASYGKSLEKALKSELSGKFEDVILASLMDPAELQAKACLEAVDRLGTKEMTLIQVLVPATNAELARIREAYTRMFNRNLEKDIKGDTSGDFQRVLVALLQGCREETLTPNPQQAAAEADALYNAGENRPGTNEGTFIRVLTQRSFVQIQEIARCYQQKYGKTLQKAIEKETSGYFEKTLVAIVKYAENKNELFATWLYETMAGAGTRDKDLIRLVLVRSELDLEDIKRAYEAKYKKSLARAIEGDTSGDYKRMLLAIVN